MQNCPRQLAMQSCVLCSFVRCGTYKQIEKQNKKNNDKLETKTSKKDTKEQQRQDADLTLSGLKPADIVIWTDGSVAESNKNGGSGILIQDIQNQQDDVKVSLPAGKILSSYRTEAVAIIFALKIIEEWNLNNTTEIRICTDS